MRPGKTQHRLLTLLLLLGLAIGVSAAESVPSLPQEFWGALTIDGSPAPAGTVVVAAINGTASGSVTTTVAGAYGGSAAREGDHLLVSGADGQEGQTLAFLVDGTAADQTVTFTPGTAMQLDLTVRTTLSPVANFTANVTSGGAPLAVQFTDASSGSPTSWAWDFENDGIVDSTEQSPAHAYETVGTYTVNLTVANAAGTNSLVKADYITVSSGGSGGDAPVADFTANVTSGDAPLAVQFTDASTGSPTSWAWDFGDGTTATEQNPTHTYTTAGTYTVKLTATNAGGSDSEEKTGYITVTSGGSGGDAPVANFTADVTSGKAPLTVNFTDLSTGSPTSWLWDFGDGTNATGQNPQHTYTTVGTYDVSLTATNADGSTTATKTGYIVARNAVPLPAGRSLNLYVANDEGVKYNVENGVTESAKGYTPYVFINNTYHFIYGGGGGGTNALHVSNDPSVIRGQVTTTTNQSGEFWLTFTGGQPNLHDAVLLLAVNGTIPDDFSVRIRSSGYDFEPPIPGVGNNNTIGDPVYVDGAINQTFTREDFIYGPQIWRPHRVSDYPIFVDQNMSDTENTFELMFIDLRLGCTQTKSDGYVRVEYELNNLTSFAVFNAYGWYSASNHGTGLIMTTSGSEYQVIGDGTYAPVTPAADFTANVTAGDAPLAVQFTDASSGSPTSWAWDFENDGIVDSTEQSPSHTYTTAGTYTVNLTVTNAAGSDTATRADYITVASGVAPVADFTATPLSGEVPLAVQFTDASTGTPTSWAWDFGDGTTATEQNPEHTYTTTGTYTVNLTVANDAGTDSIVRTGYIRVEDARVLTSITLSPAGAELKIGARQKFTAKPLDQQGRVMSGISLAWVSENESVGTVDAAGMFTALAPGETTITVANGSVQNTASVLVMAASGEQHQPSTIDIPGCNITGNPNGTRTVSVNTSAADVAVGGNEIVIREETYNVTITTEGSPEVNNGTVNGTVAGIRIDTVPVVTDFGEAGTVSAAVGANLTNIPSGAGLNVTISDNVSTGARSAFELAASQDGLTVDAVAYVMNIDRTNLDNGADIADATIRMSVSSAWVAAHGGNTSIQIIRWAEDGTKEVLETRSLGFDGDMEIFEAASPNGLSLFGLATTTAQPASPSAASGMSSGGGRSAIGVGAAENIR
ncbi:MAG: PKD domain-containing protein, partial [Methanoculleus sp.]